VSYLSSNEEVVAAYIDLRSRMIPFLRELSTDVANKIVPHCPGWTVQETVSHMVGVPDALLSGDLEGIASDAWTQRQVDRHRGFSLAALADKWESQAQEFDAMLPNIPQPALSQMVFDVTSHEHDVRHAVGRPGSRDSAGVIVGVGFMKNLISLRKTLDAAVIDAWNIPPFEVFRILGARRSLEQISSAGVDVEYVKEAIRPLPISIPDISIAE
jgi:uncharacterized protein (TIGR03083 family)